MGVKQSSAVKHSRPRNGNGKHFRKTKRVNKEREFFNGLIGEWVRVELVSTEGSLVGVLRWVEQFTILLDVGRPKYFNNTPVFELKGNQKLIYKHDISTIRHAPETKIRDGKSGIQEAGLQKVGRV